MWFFFFLRVAEMPRLHEGIAISFSRDAFARAAFDAAPPPRPLDFLRLITRRRLRQYWFSRLMIPCATTSLYFLLPRFFDLIFSFSYSLVISHTFSSLHAFSMSSFRQPHILFPQRHIIFIEKTFSPSFLFSSFLLPLQAFIFFIEIWVSLISSFSSSFSSFR